MRDRKDLTTPMPRVWRDMIDYQLTYGDSRSGWIREAVRQRFEREGINIEAVESIAARENITEIEEILAILEEREDIEGNPKTAMPGTSP